MSSEGCEGEAAMVRLQQALALSETVSWRQLETKQVRKCGQSHLQLQRKLSPETRRGIQEKQRVLQAALHNIQALFAAQCGAFKRAKSEEMVGMVCTQKYCVLSSPSLLLCSTIGIEHELPPRQQSS